MELIFIMRAKGFARKIHQANQRESEKHPKCKLEFFCQRGNEEIGGDFDERKSCLLEGFLSYLR